jgi:hypothetical protein
MRAIAKQSGASFEFEQGSSPAGAIDAAVIRCRLRR